jgi:hypothetical protein
MKRWKLYFSLTFSVLLFSMLNACSRPAIQQDQISAEPETVDFSSRMESLGKIHRITVRGGISLKTPSGIKAGDFSATIESDNMEMRISVKGIQAGQVSLKDSVVTMDPHLKEEYLEYMFAVVVRDSITWWNIHGYDLVKNEHYLLLRNSWKKVYVHPQTWVPDRQVFRLTGFRSVQVSYSDNRDFGFALLPSKIQFSFDAYDCTLTLEEMER